LIAFLVMHLLHPAESPPELQPAKSKAAAAAAAATLYFFIRAPFCVIKGDRVGIDP